MSAPQARVRPQWSVGPEPLSEAQLSLAFVAAGAAIFVIALLVLPPFPVTFDEAKYLGIGYNMIEGLGPRIVFGGYFLVHAPVWPTLVVAPAVALGVDPLIVGRVLNALSGLGLVLLAAALAWRIRPAAAAFAVIGLLATTYLHELTRTARLDVPSALVAVAYLAVGLVAVRRGSTRYAVVAGVLFGAAFLLKEIVLPLAPVPILAAVLHRQPWRPILRTAGWLTLTGALVVAPWFIFVARVGARVYRLNTPPWTLLPLAVVVIGFGVACLIAGRMTMPAAMRRWTSTGRLAGRARTWAVVAFTIAWVVALTLVFRRTLQSFATDLFDVSQYTAYVREWYPILVTTAIGAVGILLSIPAWRASGARARAAIEDLWLATVCGLPLVLLVVGVGEAPRHYLAQMAIGAGVAGAGWLWLLEATIRRLGIGGTDPATQRRQIERAIVGVLVVGVVGASGLLIRVAEVHQPVPTRDEAIATVVPWVREHVPAGSTIAFGSYLGYETALPLRADYTVRQVRHLIVIGDVDAPDGVVIFGKPRVDDWVSIDIAPKSITQYQAFSAGALIAQLRQSGAAYWIYSIGTTTSAPTIIAAIDGAPGFEQVAHWSFSRPRGEPLETFVYRLDLDHLALDPSRLHVAPDALERMIGLIERTGATELARRLAPQVVVDPRTAASDALLERLRALGQP